MPIEGEGLHLREYFKIIRKHQKTAVGFFVTTFVLVLLGTFALTPQYKATSQVIIEKSIPTPLLGGNPKFTDVDFYETQFQLIQSHAVARRVVDLLALEENYDSFMGRFEQPSLFESLLNFFGKLKKRIVQALTPSKPESQQKAGTFTRADWIAAKLRPGIIVEPVLDSRVVAISYLSPNPEFSALVANTLTKAYLEETLNMKMEFTRRTLEWMTRKADEERLKLETHEKKIQEFMRAHNLVTLENRVAVLPQQLSEVGTELVRAQTKRRGLEALYDKVSRVSNNPSAAETIPAVAADPAVQLLQAQILRAEQTIMELSGKYGEKHPSMLKAEGDLKVLKKKKSQEISRAIQSIKNEYELARSAEYNLGAQLELNKSEAQRTNEKFIQYQALVRELEANRQLYDALLMKIKEQSITGENQSTVNFWIVENARIPVRPEQPKKLLNAILGLMVGLIGGVGLAFFKEYLDNTVKDPEEAEAALGSPVLGVISRYTGQVTPEILLKEPRSAFAENYKALRTALLLSSADGAPERLLITSPGTGEGKTTTAVNLALVLAQSEKRVLLIDGDLRKPRLHKIFGISNKKGLSTYLAGTSGGDILGKGPVPELAVIPSGPVPPNPSELLTSSRMATLLDTLGQEFDIIICDSPPLLTVADSRILSRFFTTTIMVTLAGQTTYDMAKRALKSMNDVNARVLGVVINALEAKKGDYYYYEYYSTYEEEQRPAAGERPAGTIVGDR